MNIVDRCRAWHKPGEAITGDVQLYLDAANEIERLCAENTKLRADSINLKTAYGELYNADALIAKLRAALEAIIVSDDPVTIAIKALNKETK